ncbi:hypothetical protein ACY1LM_01340 [Klebsiella pneumoniae]
MPGPSAFCSTALFVEAKLFCSCVMLYPERNIFTLLRHGALQHAQGGASL